MANQEVPVCAFECLGWVPSSEGREGYEEEPDVRIPFILSAQVGFVVQVELFRQSNAAEFR